MSTIARPMAPASTGSAPAGVETGQIYRITRYLCEGRILSAAQRDELAKALQACRETGWIRIFAFVVMPDHWHGLIEMPCGTTPDLAMQWVTRYASEPSWRRGELVHWHPRYQLSRVGPSGCLGHLVRHIEENPLRRIWVRQSCDWPWSSAHADYAGSLDRLSEYAP